MGRLQTMKYADGRRKIAVFWLFSFWKGSFPKHFGRYRNSADESLKISPTASITLFGAGELCTSLHNEHRDGQRITLKEWRPE